MPSLTIVFEVLNFTIQACGVKVVGSTDGFGDSFEKIYIYI
jgi:hypothetical protein